MRWLDASHDVRFAQETSGRTQLPAWQYHVDSYRSNTACSGDSCRGLQGAALASDARLVQLRQFDNHRHAGYSFSVLDLEGLRAMRRRSTDWLRSHVIVSSRSRRRVRRGYGCRFGRVLQLFGVKPAMEGSCRPPTKGRKPMRAGLDHRLFQSNFAAIGRGSGKRAMNDASYNRRSAAAAADYPQKADVYMLRIVPDARSCRLPH